MPNQYDGLDLPIFDPERPLIGKGQLKSMAETDHDTFYRYVFSTGPGEQSLRERLEITAEEFEKISELCGTTIVNHTFGLYPVEDPKYFSLQHHKVPDGYILAAEVDIVRDIKPLRIRPANIWRGIHKYRSQDGPFADLRTGQFVQGRQASSSSDEPEWMLIDIEPRLKNPNCRQWFPV